jgi:hypothetical protein
MEVGRKLFPARIGKKRYRSDHSTRPDMRGLRNLALTLNQTGRFDEALALCDRLENECGDHMFGTHPVSLSMLGQGTSERFPGVQTEAEAGEEASLARNPFSLMRHPARVLPGEETWASRCFQSTRSVEMEPAFRQATNEPPPAGSGCHRWDRLPAGRGSVAACRAGFSV